MIRASQICVGLISCFLVITIFANETDKTFFTETVTAKELCKVRAATARWEQVLAIESYDVQPAFTGLSTGKDHPGNCNGFAFLDNERIAVTDGRHPIRVYSLKDGKILKSFGEPRKDSLFPAPELNRSDDGRLLVILPAKQPIIWDTQTGRAITQLPLFEKYYTHATFVGDGKRAFVCRDYGNLVPKKEMPNCQLWIIDAIAQKASLEKEIFMPFCPERTGIVDNYYYADGLNGRQFYGLKTMTPVVVAETKPGWFQCVEPATSKLPSCYFTFYQWKQSGIWRCVDILSGKDLSVFEFPVTGRAWNSHISPKHTLFSYCGEGSIHFHAVESGAIVSTLDDRGFATFVDETHALISLKSTPQVGIREIDIHTGKVLATLPDEDYFPLITPDGKYIAVRRERRWQPNEKSWTSTGETAIAVWKLKE